MIFFVCITKKRKKMNLSDKRIGNTEIKNFFRAIAYYINDPKTFYNFSLVNKLSHLTCREFKAMKIYEFLKEYSYQEYETKCKFKVLPNGELHANVIYNYFDCVQTIEYNETVYYEYGTPKYSITYPISYEAEISITTPPFYKYRVFLKKRNLLITQGKGYVEFMNIKTGKTIEAQVCKTCKKYHRFIFVFGSGNGNRNDKYFYSKDCYSKENYKVERYNYDFLSAFVEMEYKKNTNRNIIKSVIQYSKSL